jgi:hypothetical protein
MAEVLMRPLPGARVEPGDDRTGDQDHAGDNGVTRANRSKHRHQIDEKARPAPAADQSPYLQSVYLSQV